MGSAGKVVAGVGVVVTVAFILVSILVIGLYGGAMDLEYDVCKGPCRERTGAVGIVAGVLGFVLGLVIIAALVLPLVVPALDEPVPKLVLKLVILACLFVVIAFTIAAWSLMAKDIDDYRDAVGDACDNMAPDVWNAALAFGLFDFFIGCILFLVVAVGLVVDRGSGSEDSGAQ